MLKELVSKRSALIIALAFVATSIGARLLLWQALPGWSDAATAALALIFVIGLTIGLQRLRHSWEASYLVVVPSNRHEFRLPLLALGLVAGALLFITVFTISIALGGIRRPMGFDFELAKLIAEDLDVRLAMVVPPSRDQLIPWLLEGRGDIIAASFTITETRGAHVAFSQPYLFVDEMVVSRAGDPPMTTLADLKGTTLHVRRSSSYYPTHRRWPNQTRDHPVPQTLPCARDLPTRHDRFPRSPGDHSGRLNECLDT